MNKPLFPLSLVPAPRGWHMLITVPGGEQERLIKPGRRSEPNIPCLFNSQQEAWGFLKERFNFILECGKQPDPFQTERMRNCKQCDRIFRGQLQLQDFCPHCLSDNQFLLQQLWPAFQQETDPEFTEQQKVTVILNSSEEYFAQIPEAFQRQVQEQLALEAQQENETPSPARQLSRIIRSRINTGKRRRAH